MDDGDIADEYDQIKFVSTNWHLNLHKKYFKDTNII